MRRLEFTKGEKEKWIWANEIIIGFDKLDVFAHHEILERKRNLFHLFFNMQRIEPFSSLSPSLRNCVRVVCKSLFGANFAFSFFPFTSYYVYSICYASNERLGEHNMRTTESIRIYWYWRKGGDNRGVIDYEYKIEQMSK